MSTPVYSYDNKAPALPRCRSWRWRGWRPVRCSWGAGHVQYSKWHCAEKSTGHIWRVRR